MSKCSTAASASCIAMAFNDAFAFILLLLQGTLILLHVASLDQLQTGKETRARALAHKWPIIFAYCIKRVR